MGFLSVRERQESARNSDTLLKGQCSKSHSQPQSLGSGIGKAKQNAVVGGKTGVSDSGERTEETKAGTSCAESLFHEAVTIALGWSKPLHTTSAWGKAIAPIAGLHVDLPHGASALLKSQQPRLGSRGLGRLKWCQ